MTGITSLLPWQRAPFFELCQRAEQNRIGHAWLVTGVQGIGKLSLVMHFARYMFCRQKKDKAPCGSCADCHLFSVGNHPDWRLLQPEKKLITIDQIREAIEFACNTPQRGPFKLLCLEPAEAMNLNAANALLKLLEEPPSGTILFVISHQPGILLSTLRSRCQQLKLKLPARKEASAWLQSMGYSGDAAALLQKAHGAPLRALTMTETGVLAEHETILDCLQLLLAGETSPVQAARKCEKISIASTIDCLMQNLSYLLCSFQGHDELADPELRPLQHQLQAVGQSRQGVMALHELYAGMNLSRKAALSSNNPNPQLILEKIFSDWCKLRFQTFSANNL